MGCRELRISVSKDILTNINICICMYISIHLDRQVDRWTDRIG